MRRLQAAARIPVTDSARDFAARRRIAVWQAAVVAQALRGVTPEA